MFLLFGFAGILLLGDILNPLFIAIVLAYLLEWLVAALEQKGSPRLVSVNVVFLSFIALLLTTVFVLIPLVSTQLLGLVNELPAMLKEGQDKLLKLPLEYPEFVSEQQIQDVIRAITADLGSLGQKAISF